MTLISETILANGPMANVGSLECVPLPEILKRISVNELSGSLDASAGGTVRTLYFDQGLLVFTASSAKKDRLGQRLLQAGKLTEHELDVAARFKTNHRRIGQAIVAAGLLDEDDVGRELVGQARKIATAIFALQVGLYRFEEQKCQIPMRFRLSLSMYRLQLEGIRKMKSKKLIVGALPPPEQAVRISKRLPFNFKDVRFEPIELLVMEAAQKERQLLEIVRQAGTGPDDVFRAIYGLLCAGVLECAGTNGRAAPLEVQEETGKFPLSRLDDADNETKAENIRQEVLLGYESSQHASPDEMLQTKASEPPPPESKPAAVGDPNAEVDVLLQEIEKRRIIGDDEGVISIFYEVVELQPDNAHYEALLAQALASHPVFEKNAEHHFRNAVSLDPHNAKLQYSLGLYYQSLDLNSRAVAEFKSALRIDPNFSKARDALVELKVDDS